MLLGDDIDYRGSALDNICCRHGVALCNLGRVAALGKQLVGCCIDGKTRTDNYLAMALVHSYRSIGFWSVWRTDAGLVGGVGNGSNLSYCRLSGGCSLYRCTDCLDAFVVIARRGLFGIGIYIFGHNIPHNGDVFGGATIHHVIPIYLFYAPLYRPSGTRLGVVALDVGLGGNVVILSAPVDTFRKIEKHFSET